MIADSVSQSVLSSFKCSSMMVYLKKMFNVEICHLKQRLKRLCHYKRRARYKLLSSSGLKKICAHFYQLSSISHPLRGAQNIAIGAPSVV